MFCFYWSQLDWPPLPYSFPSFPKPYKKVSDIDVVYEALDGLTELLKELKGLATVAIYSSVTTLIG